MKPEEQQIDAATSGMTLAALDPTVVDAKSAEPENTTNLPGRISGETIVLSPDKTIIGIASFYDEPQPTASGEQYNPNAFTAAAQLRIRDKFGGIKFGRLYRPAYGLAEYQGKKVILKFNDVGPLRPGRQFDLSRAAMAHYGGLKKGLLPGFKVTPLPLGHAYPMGPVTDEELAALGIDDDALLTTASVAGTQGFAAVAGAVGKPQAHPISEFAFNARPLANKYQAPNPGPGVYYDEELGIYHVGSALNEVSQANPLPLKAAAFQRGTGQLWTIQ